MKSQLVIVESPTKAKKISQYLGKDYEVLASMGHIRDLPKSKLGVDVENDFQPVYTIPTKAKKTVTKLKKAAKAADQVILATDPDREGEAIAWHLVEAFKDKKLQSKSKRAVFYEITKEAVLNSLQKPGEINLDLVNAQQARRVLDRLVGYQISPVLWKKIRTGLSAGRVQSAALRLIVERENEIEAFEPEEYWEVDLVLNEAGDASSNTKKSKKSDESTTITARVFEVDDKKFEPKAAAPVKELDAWLKTAAYTVEQVEKKQRRRQPGPPFITSTLQQQAASRLGFSAKQTMTLAQQLYEEGYITYHRTDSFNLSVQAIQMAREYIVKQFGDKYLPSKPNYYRSKSKNAQEAHEAIRPTSPQPTIETKNGLTARHIKLYDLIFRRFVASQMTPAVYDLTTIIVSGQAVSSDSGQQAKDKQQHSLKARTSGSIVTFPGWLALFNSNQDTILPDLEPKTKLDLIDYLTEQKFTQPPPRFNDASLVKELEKLGIGRPSTYSSIIEVLIARQYVKREQRSFIPTIIGKTVTEFLIKHFPDIVDYDFTADMENKLDEISRGEKEWVKTIRDFYQPFTKTLDEVTKNAERMKIPVEPLNEPCPKCGLSPEEFAKRHSSDSPVTEEDKEHGELVLRTGRFGKFISCSRYPECDYTANYQKKIGMNCPECDGGEVIERTTRRGRTFYGCSNYPKCKFASWNNPLKKAVDNQDSDEKSSQDDK